MLTCGYPCASLKDAFKNRIINSSNAPIKNTFIVLNFDNCLINLPNCPLSPTGFNKLSLNSNRAVKMV